MSVPPLGSTFGPSDDDYYIILDVEFDASPDAIAAAYKRLARKFHPDKHNQDDRSRKEAEVIFQKIKTAYDVLSDPHKRKIYDTLGAEGLKLDGWKLVRRQMSAQEIRDEYLRLQREQLETKFNHLAKPRASFTLALDASEIFSRTSENIVNEGDEDDDIISENPLLPLASIAISSMSASVAVENSISINHAMTLSGNLNTKNGTGDGSFGANYRYKYSPATKYDLLYHIGRAPVLTAGVNHQLNERTTLAARGFFIIDPYHSGLGTKLTIAHKIRNYLIGRISYKEGINSSVTTSLIYINEKLLLEVTTSYKLTKLHQQVSVDFDYRFNNNESKIGVSIAVGSKDGVAIEYGCETRVLEINVIGAALSFSIPSGVTLKLRYNRASQEFNLSIYLSDEIYSAPLFYGTMVPLLSYYLLDRYYLRDYKRLR